jgi:hypothetical protein
VYGSESTADELFFVVMPQISLSPSAYGKVDRVLTLLPDKTFASEFLPQEVDGYMLVFQHRQKYFLGGDVTGYSYEKIRTPSGGSS